MICFRTINDEQKINLENNLNLKEKYILTYSGSIGSWYNFDQILDFFLKFNSINVNSRLIILTQSEINLNNLNIH